MPMRVKIWALMPVWRHFMALKSARLLIGRLNQPNACGLVGCPGITYTFSLSVFW